VVKQLKPKNPEPPILQTARVLFDREAKVLYGLGNAHNQIPRLFAHFEENNEFYLVQEYINGHPLSQELLSDQPWPEPNVVQLLNEILDVLAVVHQHGVIHRDIKPPNLMRRYQDKKIVLIDFGAVKEISALAVDPQGQTTATIAIGTAGYMPPEQAHGHPQRASDIYAVGVLGIQALLGTMPQQDPETGDLIWKNLVSASPQLVNILERMTRYHFLDRYQSADMALTALATTPITPKSAYFSEPPLDTTIVTPRSSQTSKPSLATTLITPQPTHTSKFPLKLKSQRWQIYVGIACAVIGVIFISGYLAINAHNKTRALEFVQSVKGKYKQQGNSVLVNGFVRIFEFNSNYAVADDNRGANYRDQGNLNEALDDFNKAIDLDPSYGIAYNDRGAIFYDQNKQQEALNDFNKAIKLNSQLAVAYNNRAYVYYNMGRKKEALADFNKAIALDVETALAVAYNGRGVIFIDQDENQKALDDFSKAIELNPHYAVAYHNRGLVYSSQGKQQEALDDCSKAISLEPKLAVAYNNRANIYYYQERRKEALDDFNKALNFDSKLETAYNGRGNIYYDQDKLKDAMDNYDRAVELDPKFSYAYLGRGNVYYRQDKYQNALDNYNKAVELDPKLAHAYYGLGNVNSSLNNKNNAIANYQKAADLYKEAGEKSDYQDALNRIKELQ
jgi:tetratricopeptide (TPR) repeat protein